MSRKGYSNFLILATLIIGFGVFGLMYTLSGQVQSEVRTAVMENEAFLRAQSMDAMLDTHTFDEAMNWSFYGTMVRTGRNIQDDPKVWDEAHVEGPRAVQDYLQVQSRQDFRSNYLDNAPLMTDEQAGRLVAPDFEFRIHQLWDRRQVVEHELPFNVTDGGSDSTEHTPFTGVNSSRKWYLPKAKSDAHSHISDVLDHEYDRFYITLYREQDTGKESLVFWTYGNDSSGSAQITFEQRPDTSRVILSDDSGELSLDSNPPGGSWGWSEGYTDGGILELPTGWQFVNISIQDSSGSVYFASQGEEEYISSDYLTLNNTYISEGMNVTMRSDGRVAPQFRAGDASVSVYNAPIDNRYARDSRYFHFYNLTQNLTMNRTFRYLVEGTTMNVSKYLQVEYSRECIMDESSSVTHDAGYGDGTNSGTPYTDGPDCKSAADDFELQGSEPQGKLADAVEEAEKKYAARIGAVLQEKIRNRTEPYYEDPDKWDPIGPDRSFEDLDVRLFVQDIDYQIYNLRRPDQYMDRKVADTKESHSDVFYRVTASRTANDQDLSCSCGDDCCGACTEQCGSKSLSEDTDISCTFAQLDCTTSLSDPEMTCSGLSGCPSIPSYFPLHENPPNSVNDGQDEFAGDPVNLDQAHDDCPGIKDQNNVVSGEDCELDNAAVAYPDGYDAQGDADMPGPDGKNYDDEGGTFRRCENTEQFWNGTHNGWIVDGDSNHPQFGPVNDPPFWQDIRFPDRYFEGDYDGQQVTQEIAYGQGRTLPFNTVVRGGTTDGSGDGEDSCSGQCGSCTYTPSGTCDLDVNEEPYVDKAFEDEIVNTTQNFRFDIKARVTVRVSVIDERFNMSGESGHRAFNFSVAYNQYTKSTFESTPDSQERCVPSDPIDPDEFQRTVVH